MKQKVGLFFGSFNPIHKGHIAIADAFKIQAQLDQLWWVPSPQNPHKVQTELAPFHDRLNMLKLALPTTNNIICDIEQHLSAPSYTIHTLDVLTQKFPNNEWVLLLGADSWNSLPTWKDGSIIESQFSIFVYPRQDQNMLRTGHMTLLSGDFHNYSSTAIRNGIRSNTSAQCDVIPAVAEYITAHRLYL